MGIRNFLILVYLCAGIVGVITYILSFKISIFFRIVIALLVFITPSVLVTLWVKDVDKPPSNYIEVDVLKNESTLSAWWLNRQDKKVYDLTDVVPSGSIEVLFSEPMALTDTTKFVLYDRTNTIPGRTNTITGTIVIAADGKRIRFTPRENMLPATSYDLTIYNLKNRVNLKISFFGLSLRTRNANADAK